MTETAEKPAIDRKSFRVLILFAIFSLCVGGAWWLATHRGSTLREGQSIIAEIRQAKLKSFWGEEDLTQWFLVRNGSQNVGWQVRYRQFMPDGSYEVEVEAALDPLRTIFTN